MDETSFDIDSAQLAEASRRFPARRLAPTEARPSGDVSYLASSPGTDFTRRAWDEAGRL
ncbi:hypothetical protein GEV29_11000 [Aeromicrobium sp. SMF47]|uniref:Uncharacterized protein n=1 Tax=Aeromicrobium yanjiei TaxID=2662028 RepID=A0A5Q2MF76_9ACTN|nr:MULTISPECIES: hypothetical protein [Aeromicrobium]MRJ77069.1 hypothetical protein [Aeromicrobium yanjiei]MRK01433.1 hypothetical protein [Aeromicrobium sp. S22]QGG41797.1 hypothetical protein GEV26_10715 [Aeromicrobium yanjiei]